MPTTKDYITSQLCKYISDDYKVNGSFMISGDWGTGKSYYIQNTLKREVAKQGKKFLCVSLYGIDSLEILSRKIFVALKTVNSSKLKKSLVENTPKILKVGSHLLTSALKLGTGFDINVDISDNKFDKIIKKFDLSNAVLVVEDLERSGISIIEVLGYINNLTEETQTKVILVANEKAIITSHAEIKETIDKDGKKVQESINVLNDGVQEYLKIKEKTVIDTLFFESDFKQSIKEIIQKHFTNTVVEKYVTNDLIELLYFTAVIERHLNYRTIIYSFQKCIELIDDDIDKILDKQEIQSIIRIIYYISVKQKINSNFYMFFDYDGKPYKEVRLGSDTTLILYRFVYENMFLKNKIKDLKHEYKLINEERINDKKIEASNQCLFTFMQIENFELDKDFYECFNTNITNLKKSLIPFNLYKAFLRYCIYYSNYFTGIDIKDIYDSMLTNIRNSAESVSLDSSNGGIYLEGENYKKYSELMSSLKFAAGQTQKGKNKTFNNINSALKELSSNEFYEYCNNRKFSTYQTGFAKEIDVSLFVEKLSTGDLKDIKNYRLGFSSVYRIINAKDFYIEDVAKLKLIQNSILSVDCTNKTMKRVVLQYFANDINDYIVRLQ